MSSPSLLGFMLLLNAVAATVVCLPVIWWYRSIRWRWWDFFLVRAVRSLAWANIGGDKGKTLSNAVIEPLVCGCAARVPMALRGLRGTGKSHGWLLEALYFFGLFASCVFVSIIYFFMPSLAE